MQPPQASEGLLSLLGAFKVTSCFQQKTKVIIEDLPETLYNVMFPYLEVLITVLAK